jgi:flagellar motor switch protein FliN/FliY
MSDNEPENQTETPDPQTPDPQTSGENIDWQDLSDDAQAATEEAGGDAAPADDVNDTQARGAVDLEAVFDIPVRVSAVLGKTSLQVSQLLKLGQGAVVELDRKVGEAIDIYVNNRLVARGEVVLVDERLGVTMTEIVKDD